MKSKVSIVKCGSYEKGNLESALRGSIELLGGIRQFIKEGSRVLLKPNLLLAVEPEVGVDTHPEFVRQVARILKQIGCKLYLGDCPSVYEKEKDVNLVYEISGMKKVAEEEGIELVNLSPGHWRGKYPLSHFLEECDEVVSLPKFKTHNLMFLTGAIKNLFGLVPGLYKIVLHRDYLKPADFANILVDIYSEVRPGLTIVDAIVAIEAEGPGRSGTIRDLGLIVAGRDCLAIDSILATITGLKPEEVLTTAEASKRGLGNKDLDSIEILGENLKDVIVSDFKLPAGSVAARIPSPFLNLAKYLLRFRPFIDMTRCNLCKHCYRSCPAQAIIEKNGSLYIDYRHCINCFCCQEICPQGAVRTNKGLFSRILKI